MTLARALAIGALGAVVASSVTAGVAKLPTRAHRHLERTNFRGEKVSLAEGVGAAVGHGAVGGCALGPSSAAAFLAAGAVGLADDVLEPLFYSQENPPPKGLKGHVGALTRGRLTTGNVKILGIGLASAALADSVARKRGSSSLTHRGLDTVLIASTANLVNLFDLRPGRAIKVTALGHMLLAVAHAYGKENSSSAGTASVLLTAGQAGNLLALAPRDLAARSMLGDAGANVLGAALGTKAALALSAPVRLGVVGLVVGLTFASEKVSFTRVIESTPWLHAVDQWGRS